jgi:hypothetical protein
MPNLRSTGGRLVQSNTAPDGSVQKQTGLNSSGAQIPARSWVDLFNNAGVVEMRLADWGNNDRIATGITTAAVNAAATGEIVTFGLVTGFAGLTPQAPYYGDVATPGAMLVTAPTGTANTTQQQLGEAKSATEFFVDPDKFAQTVRFE